MESNRGRELLFVLDDVTAAISGSEIYLKEETLSSL